MRYLSYLYRHLTNIVALLLPVAFLLALPVIAKADAAAKEQLKQANEAFTSNNYQKAAELYEAVVSSGFESAALYYNLGNAYYQQQQTAKAILNYERALRLQPHNKNTQNNIQLAKARITQPVDELPEIFYQLWWQKLTGLLPSGFWALLGVLALFAAAVFGIMFQQTEAVQRKKQTFAAALTALIGFMLLTSFAYSRYQAETNKAYAIVMQEAISLKKGPADTSEEITTLSAGIKVHKNERVNGWVRVVLTDNQEGWVNETFLTGI